MLTANLFQPEIKDLEQQLNAIARRIDTLRQAESLTDEAIQSLQQAISTASELGAIAKLKTVVLGLFGSDGGNIPSPEPTPRGDDGGTQQPSPEPEQEIATIGEAEVQAEEIDTTDTDQPAPTMAEVEALADEQSSDYCKLIPITERVSYLERDIDGAILYAYAGFSRKDVAESWGRFLLKIPNISYELRLSKRLTSLKWELKIKNLTLSQIERFSRENLSRVYRAEVCSAKAPEIPVPECGYSLVTDTSCNAIFKQWRCYIGRDFVGYVTESVYPGRYRHDKCRNSLTLFDEKEYAAEDLVNIYKAEKAVHERTNALFNPLAN